MTSKTAFAGTGAWPTQRSSRRMTTREVRELEAACPTAFRATIACAAAFIDSVKGYEDAAARAPDEQTRRFFMELADAHRRGDQVAAFRTWLAFERELSEAFKPVGEVTDE